MCDDRPLSNAAHLSAGLSGLRAAGFTPGQMRWLLVRRLSRPGRPCAAPVGQGGRGAGGLAVGCRAYDVIGSDEVLLPEVGGWLMGVLARCCRNHVDVQGVVLLSYTSLFV